MRLCFTYCFFIQVDQLLDFGHFALGLGVVGHILVSIDETFLQYAENESFYFIDMGIPAGLIFVRIGTASGIKWVVERR